MDFDILLDFYCVGEIGSCFVTLAVLLQSYRSFKYISSNFRALTFGPPDRLNSSFANMNRNLLCTLIALLVLAIASSYTTQASPVITDENTLKMREFHFKFVFYSQLLT